MLENQIGSQASISHSRQMGKFPSQPENPWEHVNEITLRNEKQLPEIKDKDEEPKAESEQLHEKEEKLKGDEQEPNQMKIPYLPFP